MKAITKIFFLNDDGEKVFGEGPYRLLMEIDETGSIRAAAANMGMAYTKALKILQNAEKSMAKPLTMRSTGGSFGGGSRLTPEGKELIKRYEAYRNACVQANSALYLEFFPEQR